MKSFLASVCVPIHITIDPPCCISLQVQNEFIAYSLGEGETLFIKEITDKFDSVFAGYYRLCEQSS